MEYFSFFIGVVSGLGLSLAFIGFYLYMQFRKAQKMKDQIQKGLQDMAKTILKTPQKPMLEEPETKSGDSNEKTNM